jgi:hypothetical protein
MYKILYDGFERDEVFDTEDEAIEYGLYLKSCYNEGAEILNMPSYDELDRDDLIEIIWEDDE